MAKVNGKFYGTGRRKKSIARVYLVPGTGNITINNRSVDEYFGLETLKVIVRQPLATTETADKFDVIVNVHGGGYTGQAGAIRHGISRALLQADADYRPALKKEVRLKSSSSCSTVLKELIFRKRRYQEEPNIQGLQKLWEVVRCAGFQTVCNTYATSMQHEYQ